MTLLFVYGSLRRGQENHAELGGARFVADSRTAPRYALRIIDGYPGLTAGARAIAGELFELHPSQGDALERLDAFEGRAYLRTAIELADGRQVTAYVLRDAEGGDSYDADVWPGPRGAAT